MIESRDTVEAVTDLVEQFDSIIERVRARRRADQHNAVRVGALRYQLAVMEQRFTVLHLLGLVPEPRPGPPGCRPAAGRGAGGPKYGVIVNEREVSITRHTDFNRFRVIVLKRQSPLQ